MKKLIAMIGAVAMSFGLFADPAVPKLNTSFETDDAGVVENTTFTPGVGSGWAGIDSVLLGKYGPGEAYAGYGAEGSTTERRAFIDNPAQDNYLPLKTDGAEVTRDVNDIFLDQLVKFTGFEDAPEISTTDKTKIALWMSGVETDEGIEGETNLYATVAKVNADKSKELVTLKLVEPNGAAWETEKWYRLTIKKIGDIYGGTGTSDAARAGFIVYVDGVQVAADDTDVDPKALIPDEFKSEMDPLAKSYMSKGMLFPAYDTTDTAFNTVSYKGIGAIDDIYIDADGPAFAQITYRTFEVTPTTGLTVQSVVSEDGDTLTVPYTVQDGKDVTVTWAVDPSYKVMSGSLTKDVTIDADNINITPTDDDIVVALIAATVNDTEEFAENELYGMLGGLQNEDVVDFVKDSTITNGEGTTVYTIPSNTKITVSVASDESIAWDIDVGENAQGQAQDFVDNEGTVAKLTKNFTFAEGGMLMLGGDVAGAVLADNVEATAAIYVSGILTADDLTIDESIQLVGNGSVITVDGFTDSEIVPVDGKELGKTALGETGLFTYTSVEPAIEYVTFTVTYNADQVENVTVKTNGEDVVGVTGNYIVESNAVVTITADAADGFKNVQITSTDVTVEGGVFTASKAAQTITITADAMVYAKVPAITESFTYNAQAKTAIKDGTDYTVAGGAVQTNAGDYEAEVALATGYDAWEDGSITNKFIAWSIAKAVATVRAVDQTIKVGESPAAYTATVSPAAFGADVIAYTVTCPTYVDAEGEYDIVVALGDNPNYDLTPYNGTLKVEKAGPVIPEPEDLPEDEKTAYNDWYTKNPADPDDTALNDPDDLKDAYLLGCKAGEDALEAARKEFKFASIEFVDDEWVATIKNSTGDDHQFYGNGKIKMGRYSDVECKTSADDGNFFKAELDYKSAE